MKVSTKFGEINLVKGPPKDFNGEINIEGFYIISSPTEWKTVVRIRKELEYNIDLEEDAMVYKLDFIGSDTDYSRDLIQYNDWYFSDKIF